MVCVSVATRSGRVLTKRPVFADWSVTIFEFSTFAVASMIVVAGAATHRSEVAPHLDDRHNQATISPPDRSAQ